MAALSQFSAYGTPYHAITATPVWPMAPTQPQPLAWERSPVTMIPTSKWTETESSGGGRSRDQTYRETKKDRDRDKRREKKESGKNNKKKEREGSVEEEQKKLDLDTRYLTYKRFFYFFESNILFLYRIALLLKGKGSGGMAPPFLTLGADSDDDSKNILNSTPKPISIPTSIDSDDGSFFFFI